MNLALEKGERVTTGGKSTGEIGGKAGEVTGVVANAPTTDSLGERYRTFNGWGMAAGKVEVLLVVGAFDADGGTEARLVNKVVNIKEGDLGSEMVQVNITGLVWVWSCSVQCVSDTSS